MSFSATSKINSFTIDYSYAGHVDPLEITYFEMPASAEDSSKPLIVFFTGFGEQRQATLIKAAEPFAEHGFRTVSVAVPFHKFSLAASRWLLDEGLGQIIGHVTSGREPYVLSGVSRGATVAAALAGMTSSSDSCKGLVVVSPHGMRYLSPALYIARSLMDYMGNSSFLDKETGKNALHILLEAASHTRSNDGLPASLRFAMEQTHVIARGMEAISKNHKLLKIFAGAKDRIYPPAECRDAIRQLLPDVNPNDVVFTVTGGHSGVASKAGQNQLRAVATWLANWY